MALVAILLYGIGREHFRQRVLRLRFEDVELLTEIYGGQLSTNPSPTMADLMHELSRRGLKLNEPLAKNTNIQCYEVLTDSRTNGHSNNLSSIIIKETDNVNARDVVEARADGSISVESRIRSR